MGNLPLMQKETAPSPTKAEKVIPSPTPTPTFDKKTLKIKILNGTGTKGFASDIKEILLEKGYSEILTGNADSFDLEKTQIQIRDDKKDALKPFLNDLKDSVTIDKENISSPDSEESADIILIVGADFQ